MWTENTPRLLDVPVKAPGVDVGEALLDLPTQPKCQLNATI